MRPWRSGCRRRPTAKRLGRRSCKGLGASLSFFRCPEMHVVGQLALLIPRHRLLTFNFRVAHHTTSEHNNKATSHTGLETNAAPLFCSYGEEHHAALVYRSRSPPGHVRTPHSWCAPLTRIRCLCSESRLPPRLAPLSRLCASSACCDHCRGPCLMHRTSVALHVIP
jgi:hypothetical protein